MHINVIGAFVTAAIWLPLITFSRIVIVRQLKRGRVTLRTASIFMAVVAAALPWLLQLTGTVHPDVINGLVLSVPIAIATYVTFPGIARLLGVE
jgi:hypothetical protein